MNSIWYSLAWKEWHEHKWKLVAITAVLWGLIAFILSLNIERDAFEVAGRMIIVAAIPLAIFVGLGVAANERARGTMQFLQSLPVPLWKAAIWKLVFGFITIITPLLLAVLALYCTLLLPDSSQRLHRSAFTASQHTFSGNFYVDVILIGIGMCASFLIWSAAAGVNRKDEVSAGAVALSAIVGWSAMLTTTVHYIIGPYAGRGPSDWLRATAYSMFPGGFVVLLDPPGRDYPLLVIGVASITHLLLASWYLRKLGRIERLEVRSHQTAVRDTSHPGWLSAPRRSAFTSIAWKQFRESMPLAFCGIAGVVGISTLFVLSEPRNFLARPDQIAVVSAGVTVVIGFIVALVAGIGVCLHDASPGLNTFWRSRPVNIDLWFWTKFFTGMLVLVAAFYAPLLIVLFCLHTDPVGLITHADAIPAQLAAFAVFAAAVMTTCLVRHAVYAAILSMAGVYIGALVGLGLWYLAGLIGWVDLPRHGWMEPEDKAPVIFGMALSFVASTLIAWLAVRYDWGRKSRY